VSKRRPILFAWLRRALPGLMLAWLALGAQIALGGTRPADDLTRALAQAVIDCQAADTAGVHAPAHHAPAHHAPDGIVISALALAPALVAVAAADIALPAAPKLCRIEDRVRPPARAPPIPAYFSPPSHAPPAQL
jgi:hypothetical protein